MTGALILFIKTYRNLFSSHQLPACRFIPTCSEYAEQALKRYGTLSGLWLGLRRLIRCRPGGAFGYDPVQ